MQDPFNLSPEEPYGGEEKREFLRLPYEYPLKFTLCRKGLLKDLQIGTTKDVSQNGMLFHARQAPPIDSIILIETDLKTLANCIEVEDALIELNGRIMGKVVRAVPAVDSFVEIGIRFIRVGEETNGEVAHAMQTVLSQSS